MKRWRILAGLAVLLAILNTGCASRADLSDSEDARLKIVCTIFPQYDWTMQILGDAAEDVEVTLLMKNGADLHSYQPTVWDMVKISEADLFLYVGGTSDFWVEDALSNVKNPDQKALDLLQMLEGSLKEHDHDHDHGHDHSHDFTVTESDGNEAAELHEEEETEYDEHIWLSLHNAAEACEGIADVLCELDSAYADVYTENVTEYVAQLEELDQEYHETAEQAEQKVLLFGDRYPFRYLLEDYGLSYYAAFEGCSAETEASFETITTLAAKVDELDLPVVLAIDGSDQKIARTIADNTKTRDQKVLVLDSMQSVSEDDIRNGTNYLSIMESNLEVLKEALDRR